MDRFDQMRIFVRVVQAGSFSRAARAEGVAQSTISKQIFSLEERLKTQLVRRTSRGLSITEPGQAFYTFAAAMLDELEVAEAQVAQGGMELRGRVRVTAPPLLASKYFVPHLPEFLGTYPELTIDLEVTERLVSLIEDGVDVAIRTGAVTDSSLAARQIGSVEAIIVASPAYFQGREVPTTPHDLYHHSTLPFMVHGQPMPWEFEGPEGKILISPAARFHSNDAMSFHVAVLNGLGIARGPTWMFSDQVASGEVVQVLKEYAPPSYPIQAVTPRTRQKAKRVDVFIQFLVRLLNAQPDLRIR
jgi:LysR family transcriptional regulator for bpeEF and oprC